MAAKTDSDSSTPSVRSKAVYTVLRFIGDSIKDDSTSDDSKESLEVAMECLQAVFGMNLDEAENNDAYKKLPSLQSLIENGLSDDEKHVEAERLKNEGNTKLKNEQYNEAISLYTRAITLSPSNPPYYANRAAAYIKIEELHKALDDCQTAVGLKPDYARAHGRMGKLSRTQEARASYQKAVECDPNNLEYKSALQGLVEAPSASQAPPMPGGGAQMPFDINNLLSNPGFMNLASSVMSNPMFQNMATRMFQQAPPPGQAPPFGQQQQQQAPPTGQPGEGGAEADPSSNPNPPPPGAGPLPPPFLGMNFATMMPHIAEMGRQMQERDPVAFEDFRQRASAQFAATHNDEPTPPKDKDDKK